MDKKELSKKWLLSYTEPSLFWIPWKKSDKPYGEYVTVTIDVPIYTGEDWQRDPVFAVYYADDANYKNPIYCTALYDKDCNIIRNGIISQSHFNICEEHGSANNPVILPSGRYKIKMLCSGGGAVINDIDVWEFSINRNTAQGKIYSGGLYDYSYRTITINPFKGFKYIQIDCETELVKTCKPSDTIEDAVIQTFDLSGESIARCDEYGYGGYGGNYFPITVKNYDEFITNASVKFYLLKAVFNEKLSDGSFLSKRGEKKIIEDTNYYKKFPNEIQLQFTDYHTVSVIKRNRYAFGNDEYSFYIGSASPSLHYQDGAAYYYTFYANCYPYDNLRFGYNDFSLSKGTTIDIPELVDTKVIFQKNNIHFDYTYFGKILTKKYQSKKIYPIDEIPNIYPNKFTQERYDVYKNAELVWREIEKAEITEFCSNETNYQTKNTNSHFGIGLQNLILDEPIPTEEVEIFDMYVEKDIYNKFTLKSESAGIIEVPKNPHKVINTGLNWEGYEYYQNLNKWSGTILYNDEVSLYKPELIPKKEEGET